MVAATATLRLRCSNRSTAFSSPLAGVRIFVTSDLSESGVLHMSARILRTDNGSEVALSDLARAGERPLVWSLDERKRMVAADGSRVPERTAEALRCALPPAVRSRRRPPIASS
jgi:hypothetical protein